MRKAVRTGGGRLWEARWRGCSTCRGPEVGNRRKKAESGTEGPQLSLERGWTCIPVGLQVSERVWVLCQLQWENHSNYQTPAQPHFPAPTTVSQPGLANAPPQGSPSHLGSAQIIRKWERTEVLLEDKFLLNGGLFGGEE